MKRPMLWFTVFYILGALLGQYAESGIVFFFAALFFTGMFMYYFNKYVLIAVLCIVLGYVNMLRLQNDYVYYGKNVEITGYIVKASDTARGRTVIIETSIIRSDNEVVNEKMRIRAFLRTYETAELGQEIIVSGTINKPEEEWLTYFKKNQIMYSTFATVISEGNVKNTLYASLHKLQVKLSRVYDSVLPKKEAAVVKSMIIGDTSELSDEIKEIYNIAGILHILSISGMHVTALALALNKALSKFSVSRNVRNLTVILFLLFYCLLTGAAVATIRATIMGIIVILSDILYRDNDPLSTVSASALGILIYEPYFLWDAGFQYSFVTVVCLIACTEPMERFLVRLAGRIPVLNSFLTQSYVRKYLSGCTVASLGSFPITAWHFGRLPLYSIISNLFIAGSGLIIILLGFLTGVVGLISHVAGTFCAGGLYILLLLYELLCRFISELPYADLLVDKPPIVYIICYYAIMLIFTHFYSSRKKSINVRG